MRKYLKAEQEYKKFVLNNPEKAKKYYDKINEQMKQSKAYYKGELIKYLTQPRFFDNEDMRRFQNTLSTIFTIINKTITEYLNNPQFRKLFGFSTKMEELIKTDPGYEINVPISRIDLFYHHSENFKFCEFNGDGSSGMNESNTIESIMTNSALLDNLKSIESYHYMELFKSWADQILNIYKEFSNDHKPNIAIVDFEGLGVEAEFKIFQKLFGERGFECVIADPRELKYRHKKLYHNNLPIDLIYRRAVNQEVVARYDEVKDFIRAYKDHNVCVVGPFRSQILHNKILFSVLTNSNNQYFLAKHEIEFIKNHFPKTYPLNNKKICSKAIQDKDKFVLKPMDSYASKGVFVGKDCLEKEWEKIVGNCYSKQEYILQNFCPIPSINCISYDTGEFTQREFNTILGIFAYDEKFSGLYTRTSDNSIIASQYDCRIQPNIIVN